MNKYPNPKNYQYPNSVLSYKYTEGVYDFILDCYNLNSITHHTPETEVLASACTDVDNLGLGMYLNTFDYLSSWDIPVDEDPYQMAFDTIQANIETYIEELVKDAKDKYDQYSSTLEEARQDLLDEGWDEDEIEEELEDEYHHEVTWLDHYKTISGWDLNLIDFKLLTEWLWDSDIQDWVDNLDDADEADHD